MPYAFLPPSSDNEAQQANGNNNEKASDNKNNNINNNINNTTVNNVVSVNVINNSSRNLLHNSNLPYGLTSANNTKADDAFSKKIRQMTRDELNKRDGVDTGFFSLIPGMQNVFSKRRWCIVKFLWVLVILFSVAICVFQIYRSISDYLQYPVVANVEIKQEKYVEFPAITLCPFDSDAIAKYRLRILELQLHEGKGFQSKGKDATCTSDMWKMTVYKNKEKGFTKMDPEELYKATDSSEDYAIQVMEKIGNESSARVDKKVIPIFIGMCFTVKLLDPVLYNGKETKVKFTRPYVTDGCRLFTNFFSVHEPIQSVNIKSLYFATEGVHIDLAVERKKFIQLNTKERPCKDANEVNRCFDKCLSDKYANEIECTLPFMKNYKKETACQDYEYNKNLGQKLFAVMAKTPVNTNGCNCGIPCERTIYSVVRELNKYHQDTTELSFYYKDNRYILVEESWQFTFVGLLCDIGGNLGLYLGLSAVSMFELVQNTAFFVKAKLAKKKRGRG